MMELRILLKRTTELLEEELSSIIALKQQHWGYSDEEQRSWFDENIMAEDLHLLIFLGGGYRLPT